MTIRFSWPRLIMFGLMAASPLFTTRSLSAADLKLTACIATPDDEAKIPAEEAGVLSNLAVKEGSLVTAEQQMGNIDVRQALLQKDAAQASFDAAAEKYNSDIEIRYAEKNSLVAKAAYDKMLAANKGMPNSVTALEILKAKLEWDTAELQIEKAAKERSIALRDMASKKAELDLGELGIKRRAILAPFNGVVVKLERNQNEWVSPGDTILRLMRLEVMRVEGRVLQSKYDPQELYDCEVTVEVDLAHRTEKFPGRVTFVSPLLEGTGAQLSYMVRAEVTNRKEGNQFLLRPYALPNMTIHLGTGRPSGPQVGLRPKQ